MSVPASWTIRHYHGEDVTHLAELYLAAIRHHGHQYYTPEQVAAWSGFADNHEGFERWVEAATTFVAVAENNLCIGFGGLEEPGRISSLYVAPDFQRHGVGSSLIQQLFAEANTRAIKTLTTEASEFSRPLFAKFGFTLKKLEFTEFRGVRFSRYVMQVRL